MAHPRSERAIRVFLETRYPRPHPSFHPRQSDRSLVRSARRTTPRRTTRSIAPGHHASFVRKANRLNDRRGYSLLRINSTSAFTNRCCSGPSPPDGNQTRSKRRVLAKGRGSASLGRICSITRLFPGPSNTTTGQPCRCSKAPTLHS